MNDTCEICGAESVIKDDLCAECLETIETGPDYEDDFDADSMDLVDLFEYNN